MSYYSFLEVRWSWLGAFEFRWEPRGAVLVIVVDMVMETDGCKMVHVHTAMTKVRNNMNSQSSDTLTTSKVFVYVSLSVPRGRRGTVVRLEQYSTVFSLLLDPGGAYCPGMYYVLKICFSESPLCRSPSSIQRISFPFHIQRSPLISYTKTAGRSFRVFESALSH